MALIESAIELQERRGLDSNWRTIKSFDPYNSVEDVEQYVRVNMRNDPLDVLFVPKVEYRVIVVVREIHPIIFRSTPQRKD